MIDDDASTASPRSAMWPPYFDCRYHATPPNSSASVTRSATESKNAPRGPAVPAALANAPSRRSGTAASNTSTNPSRVAPEPIATAATPALIRPTPVRTSAVSPTRLSLRPTGTRARSTFERQGPSNMPKGYTGSRSFRRLPVTWLLVTAVGCAPQLRRLLNAIGGLRMKSYPTEKIRNVALVGHGGSGKTTLAEALLLRAGAINRAGRVEDGTTVSDYEPEESKRHLSLSLALAPFEWKGHKVNLIDTPGYADFIGDVKAALRVADLAVFVISAVDGVEVQTEATWKLAADAGIPRMIFINKLDRERASFERTLDQIRDKFGAGIAPLELPIGAELQFRGVPDLLDDQVLIYEGAQATATEIPEDLADLEHQVHDNLVEGIVVADDAMLERFLDGDVPSPEELEHTLARGVAAATVFPVVCGSALTAVPLDRLAFFLCGSGPPPAQRPGVVVEEGAGGTGGAPDPSVQPPAPGLKTSTGPYAGP